MDERMSFRNCIAEHRREERLLDGHTIRITTVRDYETVTYWTVRPPTRAAAKNRIPGGADPRNQRIVNDWPPATVEDGGTNG